MFPLLELLVILEPIHRADSSSSGCLLRDIEFPMDPNARPESSYPLVLIRSTREEISSRGRYPSSNRFRNSAAADSPVASLDRSILLSYYNWGENEGRGGRKRKRKGWRGATTPREISVFFASSRSSMFAYGDGSNRYSMNSKNLLLAEGTPAPILPFFPSLPGFRSKG